MAFAYRSGERFVLADELRDGGREADAVHSFEVEEAGDERPELVARPVRLGGDPPVLRQLRTVEEPEDGLGVADVDSEQHVASLPRAACGASY